MKSNRRGEKNAGDGTRKAIKSKHGTLRVFFEEKNAKTPKAYFESQSQATKEALKRLSKK